MELLEILKKMKMTKWKIAKLLQVSWNTVHLWDKGKTFPNNENLKKLENLVKDSQIEIHS